MANYHKFVKKFSTATNREFDFPRGSPIDESMFDLLAGNEISQVPLEFGRSQKDVVEFAVYSSDNELITSNVVERNEIFVKRDYDFIDYNGEHRIGSLSTFDRNYPVTAAGEVVISPTHELKNLGYTDGTHNIGVSFRNEIIGASDSDSKLVIKNISPSRTELKVMPSSLKTSRKPLEVALNFEYENFFNKRTLVAHVYNETFNFIKTEGIRTYVDRVIADNEIEGYSDLIYGVVTAFKFNSYHDFTDECTEFHDKSVELFSNVMLWKYNEVFSEKQFAIEYIKCIDWVLDNSKRFSNKDVDATLSDPYDVYRQTLIAQYNTALVSAIYTARFDSYFSNVLNFGGGRIITFISASRGTENSNDNRKHRPLVIKLIEPLPTDIVVGGSLHISNTSYSDDIIQTAIMYKRTVPVLYKMRGPNISFTSSGGTREYTSEELDKTKSEIQRNALLDSTAELDEGLRERLKELEVEWRTELYGTPLSITDEISRYFHGRTEDQYLTIDYSSFENFVKFSSARKRLDVFIFKLAKVSEIDRQLESIRRSWRLTSPEKFGKLSYDTQMEALSSEKLTMMKGFDGYERFLYFEDIIKLTDEAEEVQSKIDDIMSKVYQNGTNYEYEERLAELREQLLYTYVSWPRAEFDCDGIDDWSSTTLDYTYGDPALHGEAIWLVKQDQHPGQTDIPGESDMWEFFCKCGECVGKKIPMTDASYVFLTSRTYYRPQPIPSTMAEFSQSPAYAWYAVKAKEADFYDKHNDNSLLNNTPEFITRDDDNVDYFDFLNFIGHQFDLIHMYVAGIGTIREPRNSAEKGIPNDMVSHMLNYFGGNFSGYDDGEINALTKQVKTKSHLEFIKKFKEKKNVIWRRILNNLPQILKTVGTEQSIRALFRCYGVPDYLFRTREFGGVEYNTDLSDEALYSFDTFDYYLTISQKNQYLDIEWSSPNYNVASVEFRFGFDDTQVDRGKSVEIVRTSGWQFGFEPEADSTSHEYGRFYFRILIDEGGYETYETIYLKDVQTEKTLVTPYNSTKYDVLINRNSGDADKHRRGIQIYVKRVEGQDVVYSSYAEFATSDFSYDKFYNGSNSESISFGNYVDSNFFGRLDRLRMYETPLHESRFENHILFNQSYDMDNPYSLTTDLIFKANFDYPYSLNATDTQSYGIVENSAFRNDVPVCAKCYNFQKQEYPYDFVGENIRHFAKLPSYGAQVFNNNKVRIESQKLMTQLSVASRSTLKSNDRLTADTNTVGVYFSSSDLINHEIIRFFGNFKLGDYIGNPEDLYSETYQEFERIRELFFKQGFGKLDFTAYLNIVESYVDPSLFENLKKLVPARSRLIAGLVVEPTLLERPKIRRRPIVNEILKFDDIYFNLKPNTKNMVSHANSRPYDQTDLEINTTGYKFYTKQTPKVTNWFPTEYNMNSVKNIPNELMYGVNSIQGISSGYKIEKLSPVYKRYAIDGGGNKTYNAVKISGTLLSESEFDCVFYGKLGSAISNKKELKRHIAWIHKDTTINGEKPDIFGEFNTAGYAIFGYVFNGHRVVGKLYGDFIGQIQTGHVKRLSVLGRIGGRVYDECDAVTFGGSISKSLLGVYKLTGAMDRKSESDKTRTREIERVFTDGDLNAVKIPNTIQKKIPIDIEYNTHFTIQNTSKSVATVTGEYSGKLQLDVSAVFHPPTVATFDIEWQQGKVLNNTAGVSYFKKTKTLLKIQKSSYDYVHNIVSSESNSSSMTPEDALNLDVKLVGHDTQDLNVDGLLTTTAQQNCNGSSGIEDYVEKQTKREMSLRQYDIVGDAFANGYDAELFYISAKPPTPFHVGDRVYLTGVNMCYSAHPTNQPRANFNDQYYVISKITHNEDKGTIDIEFPHEKDVSINAGGTYESGGQVGYSPEKILPIVDTTKHIGDWSTHYEYDIPFEFTQQMRTPTEDTDGDGFYDVFMRNIPLSVSYKNGEFLVEWSNPQQTDTRGEPQTGQLKLNLTDEGAVSDMKGFSSATSSSASWYFGESVTSELELPDADCQIVYKLKVNANLAKPKPTTTYPMIIDESFSMGDTVEVVFRRGTYLWHSSARGLESITGVVTCISELDGERSITIKNGDDVETFTISSTHVYSLRVVKSADETHTKEIDFNETYSEKLRGISASEKKYYPDKNFKKLPIKINASTYVTIEKPFEYYNIKDIGTPTFSILEGKFPQHKSNYRNVFSASSKRRGDMYCRRSVSSTNTTISPDGGPDKTPAITRKRKTSIQDGAGDSFWYLADEPVSTPIDCGHTETTHIASEDECTTPPTTLPTPTPESPEPSDLLNLDSLQLHYTFESDEESQIIHDKSGNQRHGTLHSAEIRDGGESRSYRKLLRLDNDVRTNPENMNSYLSVSQGTPIGASSATISFWIRPTGISDSDVGIVLNNSTEPNNRHGIILNPGGNRFSLGYTWQSGVDSHNIDLEVELPHDAWTHVVILIYAEGFVRTFVNKSFVNNYDLGVRHSEVTFDNLEIGRFSGMIDDIRVYNEVLDYGNVMLAKEATGLVGELYDSTRQNDTSPTTSNSCEEQPYNYTYHQSSAFIQANDVYVDNPGDDPIADPEIDSKRKFVVQGGPNAGIEKNATTEFMGSLCGKLKEIV
jgi:hypothetical protein